MKAFRIAGEIEVRKRSWQKFSKELTADDEEGAREKTFSVMGSKHRKKRRSIRITSVEEISPEEITDLVVKYELGGG